MGKVADLLRKSLIYAAVAVLFFTFGFVFINFVLMPYIVSSGETTKIPDLIGMEYEKASQLCLERGLVLSKQGEKYEEEMPPGFIIVQDPLPELVMKRGRRVDVIVSLGQELTSIPDISGLEADRATSILQTAGLKVMGQRHESSEVVAEGKVMSIEPPAGSRVRNGTEVTLIISSGPISFVMPLLEERTIEEARHIIEDMGLTAGKTEYVRTDLAVGTVVGQKPPAGSRVVQGQKVELVVSSGE